MPRRMITSDIFRNDKVAELDHTGRLFFIGLITNADDDGRVKGSLKYLKANIFPYDDISLEQLKQYRQKCHEIGIAYLYSVNGTEIIALTGWFEHQSIRTDTYKESKLPAPIVNTKSPQSLQEVNSNGEKSHSNIIEYNIIKYNKGNLKKFPPQFINFRKQLFEKLKEKRGYSSRQPAAEAKAMSEMLKEGFSVEQIIEAYDLIKKRSFFADKNLSMMQVKKDIHEVLKNKTPRKIQDFSNEPSCY